MTKGKATAIGFVAVLLWSLLALFTVGTVPVPPFQLAAMTFLVGSAVGLVWIGWAGEFRVLRQISWRVYLFGTLGLFGYHALYFSALRMAPAAEAGLIAYLWPLLIVLFSGLLPGERLEPLHILGAVISFIGAAILVLGGATGFATDALPGFGLAFLGALTWSGYSVLSRRLGNTPTASVTVFCLMTAVLSTGAHLLWETTVWPPNALGWTAVLGLGLGPVGLAFYVWDVGVKQGDIQLLGVASYGAPLLSTLVLIVAGVADPRPSLILAGVLITFGAAMAARASSARSAGN
ncbi:EamA domain-containing membrane protein RarD [Aliiroseovarius sediminilitoris]|uniref:EamA domain-containing membrane protein RarD n=1 Tax=Aliiroseovarius sediminilitoris TaxID=1173584 RepID=A0A1I0QTZ2_9RHOB|nr:EamA family transporter [Aliiroseovarius sediminilitoris]SEW30751.1 EamA domain-containing membrane protein RarD [Aliiroseovarius sediminilitoris]